MLYDDFTGPHVKDDVVIGRNVKDEDVTGHSDTYIASFVVLVILGVQYSLPFHGRSAHDLNSPLQYSYHSMAHS